MSERGRGGGRGEFRGGGGRGEYRGGGGNRGEYRGGRGGGGGQGEFRGGGGGQGEYRGGGGGRGGGGQGEYRGGGGGRGGGGQGEYRGGGQGEYRGGGRGGGGQGEYRGSGQGELRGGSGRGGSRGEFRGGESRGSGRGARIGQGDFPSGRGDVRGDIRLDMPPSGTTARESDRPRVGPVWGQKPAVANIPVSVESVDPPLPVMPTLSAVSSESKLDSQGQYPLLASAQSSSGSSPSKTGHKSTPSGTAQQKKKGPKKLEAQLAQLSLDTSLPEIRNKMLPRRPDEGCTIGEPIRVFVNCWDMTIADVSVYMYDIEATSAFRIAEGKKIDIHSNPKGLREYLACIISKLPNTTFYDGGRIIYSLKPIPNISTAGVTKEETVTDPLGRDDLLLKYTMKEVSKVSSGALMNFVNDPNASTFNLPQDSINMIDCIIKWINKAEFINFGRAASFVPTPYKECTNKLFVIHRGFLASIRPQWKVRCNVDMVHKAFFPSGNLADILYSKYGDSMADPRYWRRMENDITMIRVVAGHYKNEDGKEYKRRFTIHGLSKNRVDQEMIEDKKMSTAAYFAERYNIKLKFPELPCVKVKRDKAEFMPMELLTVLPYQNPKADKGDVASEIIRCSAVRPQERFAELDNFVKNFVKQQHFLSKQFQLNLDCRSPVQVPARILPQPKALFGGNRQVPLGRGKWNMQEFFSTPTTPVLKWAIFSIPPDRFAEPNARKVQSDLPRAAFQAGVRLDKNPIIGTITFADLQRVFADLIKQQVNLAIFVLYDNFSYSQIKRLGDIDVGIKTQCIKGQTLGKPNVCPNLMLKINAKLGGTNWVIQDLHPENLIMVMGADVTHPGPTRGDELRKSVAAVIGSISADLMQYAAVIRQQDTTERGDKATREVIDSMDSIVTDLLKAFGARNNDRLPNRIIFYRDGVSEGQFERVLLEELTSMQRACCRIRPGYQPAITFIVVQKRHHIRFKPLDPRARNVDPGTVVDRDVVHRREFDFFLCSQEGIQGTSKPAHYHVLYDDNNWTSNSLQSFTYFLCHAYMRCTRSVSYPAPTFYSHLAAFRARDWLKDCNRPENLFKPDQKFKINPSQENFMFFL